MNMRGSIEAALLGRRGESAWQFRFRSDEPTFAGHFPGRPVLPGVFQVEMSRFAAERALHCRLALREISKAKFVRPILPEEIVEVDLKLSEKDNSIHARAVFTAAGQPAGEMVLVLWRND
jgi:3-hydroxymyristoyl/3-hydroxydecanoyl-(acyl carrier protein) dehydratase